MPKLKQPIGLKRIFGLFGITGVNSVGTDVEVLVENDGTVKTALYGKNSSAALKSLRVNANDQQQVEVIEGSFIQVDPVLIPNAEGLLWNPGTTNSIYYKVMFNIVNSTSSDVTGVKVGQDIGAGGSLSAVEYWVQGMIVPGNGASGWYGPFLIPGDDRVRGVAGTNNVLGIHWLIKQVA